MEPVQQKRSRLLWATRPGVWEPVLFFVLIFALLLWLIYSFNNGTFTYSLDDSYIHLALAENLAQGHYGINMSEPSAPSSSIAWPFVLALFAHPTIPLLVPLALNFLASIATLFVAGSLISSIFAPLPAARKSQTTFFALIFLIVAANLIGLAFGGMEHSVQILLSVVLVVGMIHEHKTNKAPWWLGVVIVLGPLIRYENMALSVPALAYLAWRRHYALALGCGSVLLLTIGGFSLFLHSLGLNILPSSVLTKSSLPMENLSIKTLVGYLISKVMFPPRQWAIFSVGLLLLLPVLLRKNSQERALALWIASAGVLHLLLGRWRFGWVPRYELYIWVATLLTLAYFYRDRLVVLLEQHAPRKVGLFLAALLLIAHTPYLYHTLFTPMAANNIYQQQYQMHRFVVDYYDAPVAVNDLGLVSYHNDHYVLDLIGLASEDAREAQQSTTSPVWMEEMTRDHNTKLVMIYQDAFNGIPTTWIPIGSLHIRSLNVSPFDNAVMFYALDDESFQEIRPLLVDFRQTLPPGVEFMFQATS
jgi:hypothetical protein